MASNAAPASISSKTKFETRRETTLTRNPEEFRAPQLLPFAQTGQKFLRATAAMQAHSVRALLRYQIEGLSFLKRRFEDDLRLVEELTGGDGFVDAFDIFVNFIQNATSDYANEAGKFASIGARLASETADQVRKDGETTIDDMAAATLAT
ncbi:MAG: phasin family protein [Mesorhizobium sp.]|nr:MAG: phasin family protein [Mesorhizobium sp.]